MRMYTDSADAIKAYAEEVDFDLSQCVVTEHTASAEHQRGGLTIAFQNYHGKDMQITIVHTWADTFDITFWNENKGPETLSDQYFDDLMTLFVGLKEAFTGITQAEWNTNMELYSFRKEEE